MKGKLILVTAGPTYEPIDPVRFIGNRSSGNMGYSIAEELIKRGAEVLLISGPVSILPPKGVNFISVETANEMYLQSIKYFSECDAAILCAAVADYTPKHVADQKIKKSDEEFRIELVKTKDIAKELGKLKSENQILAGFALETENEEVNANKKLESKNLDFIVLNSLQNKDTCFQADENQIVILERNNRLEFPKKLKTEVAIDIVDYLEKKYDDQKTL